MDFPSLSDDEYMFVDSPRIDDDLAWLLRNSVSIGRTIWADELVEFRTVEVDQELLGCWEPRVFDIDPQLVIVVFGGDYLDANAVSPDNGYPDPIPAEEFPRMNRGICVMMTVSRLIRERTEKLPG